MLLAYSKGPRLVNCSFRIQDPESKKEDQIVFNLKIQYKTSDDQKEVHVFLGFNAGDENSPFAADISSESIFRVKETSSKPVKPKEIAKAVYLEAAPAIFPLINDYFTDLCRKGRLPIIDIPSIDFQAFYSENKDQIKEEGSES